MFSRLCLSARPRRRMGAAVAAFMQPTHHRPGGGSLWEGDQLGVEPRVDGRHGALRGWHDGAHSIIPLPQSPGPGTGTRLWGAGRLLWRRLSRGIGLLARRSRERKRKKRRVFRKVLRMAGVAGRWGRSLESFACGVAQRMHIGRPHAADSGSPITSHLDPTGFAIPRSSSGSRS